ncbi:MAG: hypothetical protein IPM29_00525 [Planctomycetes bacterium]|nr:hypothetical protein [Planctomycetota bacterium]
MLDVASARISRYCGMIFALLLALTSLSFGDELWPQLLAIALFAFLVGWIVKEVLVLWRASQAGALRGADDADLDDDVDDQIEIVGVPRGHGHRPHDHFGHPPAVRHDADLEWFDPEEADAAAVRAVPERTPPPVVHVAHRREPPPPVRPAQVAAPPTAPARAEHAGAPTGFAIEVLSLDDGVVDLRVHAFPGRDAATVFPGRDAATVFPGRDAATVRLHVPLEDALRFGDALAGFPTGPDDRRMATLGTFAPTEPDGGLRLVVFTRQGTGRVYATLWPDAWNTAQVRQTVSLAFTVPVPELADFARAVALAALEPGKRVELQGVAES